MTAGSGIPAGALPAPDQLREELLARARWPDEDPVVDGEEGWEPEPASLEEELGWRYAFPESSPPEGEWAWLADLPGPLLDEYAERAGVPQAAVPEGGLGWELPAADGTLPPGADGTLPPGPALAGLAGGAWDRGLDKLSDDGLIGVLSAAHRLGSWSAALEISAVGELIRRREAGGPAGDSRAAHHISDEIAAALALTGRAADALMDKAVALAQLPATMTALRAGEIDARKAFVLADETAGLAPSHRSRVEAQVLAHAWRQTTAQLRAAAHRAVLRADPAAARARREAAEQDARVERWAEHAGTAALSGRDLPPAATLAADQHLTACAKRLKAAGVPGPMDQLRAHAYLALLAGQPVASLLPASPADGVARQAAPSQGSGSQGAGSQGSGSTGPFAAVGAINLTVPLATWLGLSEAPGDVSGYGPLSGGDTRDLAGTLAGNPATRWCVTLTDGHRHAVAHSCARAGPPGTAGTGRLDSLAAWLAGLPMEWLAAGSCGHERQSAAYRPLAAPQHLIRVRQRACGFPGCRRPAEQCDLDHTVPFGKGGQTCECNLAPLCRRHHQVKQASGWRLDQPRPGHLTWTAPSGRSYLTGPTVYPG